jgi:hypothetical protein
MLARLMKRSAMKDSSLKIKAYGFEVVARGPLIAALILLTALAASGLVLGWWHLPAAWR